ncbi:hypothetical protein Tsubulata_025650 [Turnera subulata]|uniref:YqgF/RNase H-like domain-containing protein n=1 Tax=Turnera subulata TaxID=218843 RepID=A0A9Q0JB88_9ROSI|nr:hypothetical protein Tsubulata_025650 [Turnera subulata]
MVDLDLDAALEMESDIEKICSSDQSPNTVLPYHHCPKSERRSRNSNFIRKDELLKVKDGFTEITFRQYRSTSCKNVPSRLVGVEGNVELKRGSIYQSSREVRKMKRMGSNEGRQKIELSRASDTSFSFRIVDSLFSSDEENTQKRSSLMSVKSNPNRSSVLKPCVEPVSSNGFIEFCPNLDNRGKESAATLGSGPVENLNLRCEQITGPQNDGNVLPERDMGLAFNKSLSAKAGFLHPPSPSESDLSSGGSSRSRFSPIRRMFDPFVKSKSLRSSLGNMTAGSDVKVSGTANMRRNHTLRKSLLHDFAHRVPVSNGQHVEKDQLRSAVTDSPVHLHGSLKLETKHGVPFFQFSSNCPEEVFVAKVWKANTAFNWVYTFHSMSSRKKSNASGRGLADGNKESLVVAQMQVSCYLCSDLKEGGGFDNSVVTEFVLYDIAHARQSVSSQQSPDDVKPEGSSPTVADVIHESDDGSDAGSMKHKQEHAFARGNFDPSNPYPYAPAQLHPNLEIAAIVIQLPFAKRESLKCKRGGKSNNNKHLDLLNLATTEQNSKDIRGTGSPEKVKVVIPAGHHSLPGCESPGPSSILDRWRFGGGCDCGGWDMACPLTVFGNPDIQGCEDQVLMDNRQPLELFVQGSKEKIPALTMSAAKEGQYAIDFHAQLSTLQAFAICVALLHGTETTTGAGEERNKLLHCNSLKVLIDEEVKHLIEKVTEEEGKKASKKIEDIQQSYVPNPPFSPISRMKYLKPWNLFQDLMNTKAKRPGRLLGLDVGDKYVGLAVSDQHNKIASPLSVLLRKKSNIDLMADDFKSLISDCSLKGFVVGHPLDRQKSAIDTMQIKIFVDDLRRTGKLEGVKYTYWDECFTSKNVELLLQPLDLHPVQAKSIIDKFAAVGILQNLLNSKHTDAAGNATTCVGVWDGTLCPFGVIRIRFGLQSSRYADEYPPIFGAQNAIPCQSNSGKRLKSKIHDNLEDDCR